MNLEASAPCRCGNPRVLNLTTGKLYAFCLACRRRMQKANEQPARRKTRGLVKL